MPSNAIVMANAQGTAPGFIAFRQDGKFIASMPGVPREMRAMLAETLIPWLRDHFDLRGGIVTRTLHTVGIPESEVDVRIEDLFRSQVNPKIAVLASGGRVDIKLMAKVADLAEAPKLLQPLEALVRARFEHGIFGVDDETLEGLIIANLSKLQATIAFAESCTGGALTDALVRVPGASRVLRGSIVAYANEIKQELLSVSPEILREHGAVSEACAIAMAQGALARFNTNFAISTTGIAGPDGGTSEKPVGTVYIGIASREHGAQAFHHLFSGDRFEVRTRSVLAALRKLFETIQKHNI